MNTKLKHSEWIEQYVDGDLSHEQMAEFERELAKNKILAFEYNLDRELTNALADEKIIDFRKVLIDVQHEVNHSRTEGAKVIHLVRKYWYAAASIILILAIAGSVLLLGPGEYTNEKLFSMYYSSGESVGISRSGNTNVVEALFQYQQGNYVEASMLFNQLLANDPDNAALNYYCGISNIEVGNYQDAIEKLNYILETNNSLYVEYAQWYLGLTYLINGQTDKAAELFEDIANEDGHYYQDEASSILIKIESNVKNKNLLNKILFFVLPF